MATLTGDRIMNYVKPVLSAMTVALTLGACDSKQEPRRDQAVEQQADKLEQNAKVIRKEGEATADRIEKQDPGLDSRTTDRTADAARETAKKRAHQLEDQADQLREKK
jgi:hypothetical protein